MIALRHIRTSGYIAPQTVDKVCYLLKVVYQIRLMMMMMMMIFQGSCWAWPPRVPPLLVLGFKTFTTDGIAPTDNPLLTSISRLLRHAEEHSGSILLTPKLQGVA